MAWQGQGQGGVGWAFWPSPAVNARHSAPLKAPKSRIVGPSRAPWQLTGAGGVHQPGSVDVHAHRGAVATAGRAGGQARSTTVQACEPHTLRMHTPPQEKAGHPLCSTKNAAGHGVLAAAAHPL